MLGPPGRRELSDCRAVNCVILAARHLLRDLWAVHTNIKELFQFVILFSFRFSISLEQGTYVQIYIFLVYFPSSRFLSFFFFHVDA